MRSRQMWLMIGGLVGTLSLGTFAVAAEPAPTTQTNTQGEQAAIPSRSDPNTVPRAQPGTQPRTDRETTPTEDPQRSGIAVPGNAAKRAATPLAAGTAQMGDPTWIAAKLHRVNQGEIKVASIEREQGESTKAKAFAAQLVRDHERADRQLMAYAKQKKIDLDAVPTTGESDSSNRDRAVASGEDEDDVQMQAKVKELQGLKGADLDRQFASTMVDGHAKVMDLVRNARAATKDRQLKTLLGGLLPTLENHHRIAAMLNNTLGGTSSIEPTHQR